MNTCSNTNSNACACKTGCRCGSSCACGTNCGCKKA